MLGYFGVKKNVSQPGYNISPEYDMKMTRKYLYGQSRNKASQVLPLTSMIDMFSMVVIFLILNFSAKGDAFYVSRGISLPKAKSADLMETYPLVSIFSDRVYLDDMPADEAPIEFEEREKPYPKLRALLKRIHARMLRESPGKKVDLTVNVQADESMPVWRVKEVMKLLIEEGWTGIQLTVKKKE
jgi:biopolymer transport protein ExbD